MPKSPILIPLLLVAAIAAAPAAVTAAAPDAGANMAPGGGGDCITRCNNQAEQCRKAGNSVATCAGSYNSCMLQCNQSSTVVGSMPGTAVDAAVATPPSAEPTAAVAPVADDAPSPKDSGIATSPKDQDLVKIAYDAIVHGNWWMLAGVLLMGTTFVARRGLSFWHPGFEADRVGVVMVAGIGAAAGVAHSLMAGHTPDLETWRAVMETVMAAVTVYVVPKKIIRPS